MFRDDLTTQGATVEDVLDNEVKDENEDVVIPSSDNNSTQSHPAINPDYSTALIMTDSANKKPKEMKIPMPSTFRQQVKASDDSSTAFGDQMMKTLGDKSFAPRVMLQPSAPELEPQSAEEWQEYYDWMNAPSFADRQSFPHHKRWSEIVLQNQDHFRINPTVAFVDQVSKEFREKVAENKDHLLLNGHEKMRSYREMPLFVAHKFEAQAASIAMDNQSQASGYVAIQEEEQKQDFGFFDQIQAMIEYTDHRFKTSYAKSVFSGQEISNNSFYVVSDHNGTVSGRKFQLWGAGLKDSLTVASLSTKQNLGKVQGSAESYPTTIDYAHVPGRFTIIRINQNELGFALNRLKNQIEKIQPGRYLIPEYEYAYIGKAALQPDAQAILVQVHDQNKDQNIEQLAAQLQVVLVRPGTVAFVKDNINTYVAPSRPEVYLFDKRRGEQFINYQNTNQPIWRAADQSYTVVNQLQPGQFVLFQHNNQVIVWHYDAARPTLNTLHLPANQFLTEGVIHNIQEEQVHWQGVHVVNANPSRVTVVKNQEQEFRFVEAEKSCSFVLRLPWQFVKFAKKNEARCIVGNPVVGSENKIEEKEAKRAELQLENITERIMLGSSEWVAVVNRGSLSFYPPRLDSQPYYFSQPESTVIGIVDKNRKEAQKLDVPGIGNVTIVNIASGELAIASVKNVYCFLNPSNIPYIIMPPDKFIRLFEAKKSYETEGDLHRIVIAPDERAVISKDGELFCLPDSNAPIKGQNGVYVFRANQFKFEGEEAKPVKKSEKQARLGVVHYFRVDVGEVGYGYHNGELKIWGVGSWMADNRVGEYFEDFFPVNADPIKIQGIDVTFKHGIAGKVDIQITYAVVDPKKTLNQFTKHSELHDHIAQIARGEILTVCAQRPPLGYSDLDFQSESKNESRENLVNNNKTEMETDSRKYLRDVLEKLGIEISSMYINHWTVDEKFVQQIANSAMALQSAQTEVAQQQIALQKMQVQNAQQELNKQAEIARKRLENEKLALDLQANTLQQESQAKIAAASQVAQSEAAAKVSVAKAQAEADAKLIETKQKNNAEIAQAEAELQKNEIGNKKQQQQRAAEIEFKRLENEKLKLELAANQLKQENETKTEANSRIAKAEADSSISVLQAKASVEAAEQKALAALAEKRAEAKSLEEIAKNKLAAKEAETNAKNLDTAAEKARGEMEAEIAAKKKQAEYAGLSEDGRKEVRLAELGLENTKRLLQLLMNANAPMKSIVFNPELLELLQLPTVMQSNVQSPGNFGLFPMRPVKSKEMKAETQEPLPETTMNRVANGS